MADGTRIFPKGLGTLGYVLAVLFLMLYLGRLLILSPAHPVMIVLTLLSGFLIGPAWYGWLGIVLRAPSPGRAGGDDGRGVRADSPARFSETA